MSTPRIMFDDGSRIIMEAATPQDGETTQPSNPPSSESEMPSSSPRGNVPLDIYYEVTRVAKEAVNKLDWSENSIRGQLLLRSSQSASDSSTSVANCKEEDDGFLCRIALQFPDELLSDAPEVSWLMEDAIVHVYKDYLLRKVGDDNQSLESIQEQINLHLQKPPLVFILGDTTYNSCCPDEVSANHLNAQLIVHYGYACLSATEILPTVYAFGVSSVLLSADDGDEKKKKDGSGYGVWKECVQLVSDNTISSSDESDEGQKRLLLLYEVKYHHAIDELKLEFDNTSKFQEVVLGKIPKQQLNSSTRAAAAVGYGKVDTKQEGSCCGSGVCSEEAASVAQPSSSSCCNAKEDTSSCCAQAEDNIMCTIDTFVPKKKETTVEQEDTEQYIPRTIGGLEIPNNLDLTEYVLLYIGDDLNIDDGNNKNAHTRLLHILLRCSAPDGPKHIWSYSPIHRQLNSDVLNSPLSSSNDTTLSTVLSRILRRRYFLLNKAKLANTIAILIGTTSNSYSFRRLLSRTRNRIEETGRTAYTFAVGKLSTAPNKLANFAEIDAFVLIACSESIANFWQMEREEMLVPVLTPLELDVALGFRDWDGRYSCDFGDLIRWDEEDGIDTKYNGTDGGDGPHRDISNLDNMNISGGSEDDDDDDDEPFFSMISGKYEQSRTTKTSKLNNNLEALPGQGKLIEYRSEAAEFLKNREYRGLEANVGETEVKAAVVGQVGIASNYGEDDEGGLLK